VLNMKSITLRLLLSILLSTPTISQSQQQLCPIPTTGCPFGMYNQQLCKCECIPPYCLDVVTGNCIRIPNQVCNINPWINCIKGTNCPWYKHTSETCTTSNTIPPNVVNIYNTKEICCNFNYPYSDSCAGRSSFSINAGQPTKHPTISRPEESEYEVIPIKFDVLGLPNGIRVREVKDEMTTVLKRVLLRLSDDNEGSMEELIISNVEEKVMPVNINDNTVGGNSSSALRSATSVTLYYNVYLVRNDNYKFGPIIINEIRNRYNEILDQIQSFADTKYFGGNLKMNWCTVKNGRYDLCVLAPNVFDPSSVENEDGSTSSKGGSGGGLAGWSIALIVIIVLLVVGCGLYWIGVVCYGMPNCLKYDYYQSKDDIYFDSRSRATDYTNDRHQSRRRRYDERADKILMLTNGYDDRRSQRPLALTNGYDDDRRSQRPLALTNGDDGRRSQRHLALTNGDDRGISNSGRSRRNKSSKQQPLALTAGSHYQSSRTMNTRGTSSSKKSSVKRIKPACDPSLYIPGQEDKPDPEGSIADEVLMLTAGAPSGNSRKYYDDDNTPPPKVKREPTMYIDGEATIEEDDPKPLKSAMKKKNDRTQQQIVLAESSFNSNGEENKRYPDYMASFKTEDYDMPPPPQQEDDEEDGYYIDAISQGEPSFLTEEPSYATQSKAQSRAQSEYSRKKKKSNRR